MRITDLLENAHFKSEEFIKKTNDGNEIDYDLIDDLVFYLNNDDNVYRHHLLPTIHKFIDLQKADKEIKYTIFKSAVAKGYKEYIKQYPIRELPNTIDSKSWRAVCKKLFNDISKDMEDGHYDHN
jgi:hypothetical protein